MAGGGLEDTITWTFRLLSTSSTAKAEAPLDSVTHLKAKWPEQGHEGGAGGINSTSIFTALI